MLTKIRNLENQDVLSCHAAAAVFRRRTGKGARGAAEIAVVFRFALVLYVDYFGIMNQC
jgi:hypothetical protein